MRKKIALLAATFIVLAGVPVLLAMPEYAWSETYYSDATLTTVVGHRHYLCSGTYWDGTTSDYVNISIHMNCGSFEPDHRGEPNYPTSCSDNIDNDGDGYVDDFDPDCW